MAACEGGGGGGVVFAGGRTPPALSESRLETNAAPARLRNVPNFSLTQYKRSVGLHLTIVQNKYNLILERSYYAIYVPVFIISSPVLAKIHRIRFLQFVSFLRY